MSKGRITMYYKITNGAVTIGTKTILEEVNLEIKEKDRIAVIGRNGAGKTTLLKALMDNQLWENGIGEEKFNIFKSGKFEIGYLNQNNRINEDKTLLEEILTVYDKVLKIEEKIKKLEEKLEIGATTEEIEEYENLLEQYKINGGYEYKKEYKNALIKFGFEESEQEKLIRDFSGGEKTKIAFLKVLLSKPDLLLLDEPTNHLDMEAIIWLEDYLKNYPASFVVVSHDRMFINKVTNKIIEIEYGKTEEYFGNYEYYEQEKKRRFEASLKDYELQQKEIKRLQRIVDRFRYKPSKASMAMSKLKQLERMEKLSPPERENLRTFHIRFDEMLPSGKLVLEVENLKIGYKQILSECSFLLLKGRRLGIIGENGIGKSTLLKTIMNKTPSLGGQLTIGSNVTIGYFDQELNNFNENLTVYEEYQSKFPEQNDFTIRKNLAAFLFYSEDVEKKVSELSGGEKVRLALGEVVTKNPNFLLLDEPTNHLDILSKERLEAILQDYPGTILFVSHDRYFMNKVADSLLVIKKNKSVYYDLTYEEYLERIKESDEKERKITTKQKPKVIKKDNTKEVKNLEKRISLKEKEIKALKEKQYEPETYLDEKKAKEINKEITIKEEELLRLTEKWEELYQE